MRRQALLSPVVVIEGFELSGWPCDQAQRVRTWSSPTGSVVDACW
jgi:hypothetical protein